MQGAPRPRCDSQAKEGKAELLVKVCAGSAPELSFASCFGLSVSAEQPHCTLSSSESKPLCAKAQPWSPGVRHKPPKYLTVVAALFN